MSDLKAKMHPNRFRLYTTAVHGKAVRAGMGTKYKSAGAQPATVSHRAQ